jgi:nucleotide-binding universal stress UspA family protein
MTTISRILVPIDFLPHSAEAVRRALDIAHCYSAEVILLHVYQPAEYPLSDGDVVYDERQLERATRHLRARLDAVRREVDPVGRQRVSVRVLQGTPERAIVEAASSEPFDLIVMGTHGRTGVDRIVSGSIAERVMRHAPCAVLTVKSQRSTPARRIGSGTLSANALSADASVARRWSTSLLGAPGVAIARAFSRPWR